MNDFTAAGKNDLGACQSLELVHWVYVAICTYSKLHCALQSQCEDFNTVPVGCNQGESQCLFPKDLWHRERTYLTFGAH